MLKVMGRTSSSNVQKVMWCVGELGLAHERTDIGGPFGGNKEPAYLAMNPNGLVPTIDDDGFILWESHSIVRYLAAKHGAGSLWPTDIKVRADADRWMDWQLSVVNAVMFPVFWGLIRTKPEERDLKLIETSAAKLVELFDMLDKALAGRAYVAGDHLTIGDFPLGVMAYRYHELVKERHAQPNLAAWYGRLKARPAFAQHVMLPLT